VRLPDQVRETQASLDATRQREAGWSGVARRAIEGLRRTDSRGERFWVTVPLDFFDPVGSSAAALVSANAHADAGDVTTLASAATYTDSQIATRQKILAIRFISTTPVTATSNEAIVSDSSGGARVVTLPAAPADGDVVRIKRMGGSTVTANRNSLLIDGAAANFDLTVDGQSVDFVYDVTTTSWYTFA